MHWILFIWRKKLVLTQTLLISFFFHFTISSITSHLMSRTCITFRASFIPSIFWCVLYFILKFYVFFLCSVLWTIQGHQNICSTEVLFLFIYLKQFPFYVPSSIGNIYGTHRNIPLHIVLYPICSLCLVCRWNSTCCSIYMWSNDL